MKLARVPKFSIRASLFMPDEGSCYVFSTRNNCCEFLAFHGVTFQSVIKSFFKTSVFVALLWYQYVRYLTSVD